MFSFFKKTKAKGFFPEFFEEFRAMIGDIVFVYTNIIHWGVSKIIISLWSIVLGVLVALPFFVLSLIVGAFDPISWLEIVRYIITGTDISLDLIGGLANHPYWIVVMAILISTTVAVFLLASSYSLLLQARLVLSYIERKKLAYKDNLYTSPTYISTFMGLLCWNTVYLIAPFFIGFSFLLGVYVAFDVSLISQTIFLYLSLIILLVFTCIMIYVFYNILFGYTILAKEKQAKVGTSRSYLRKSIDATSLKNFYKFLIIILVYFVFLAPVRAVDHYIENALITMKDAYVYKSGTLDMIKPEDRAYFEYITKEFKQVPQEAIAQKIKFFTYIDLVNFFVSYFLFGGLFIVVIVSFYSRILMKK